MREVVNPKKEAAITKMYDVTPKAQWALKWCDTTTASFAKHMIAFAAVKGIFFLGIFMPSSGSSNVA
jgi:hypothetical protein